MDAPIEDQKIGQFHCENCGHDCEWSELRETVAGTCYCPACGDMPGGD